MCAKLANRSSKSNIFFDVYFLWVGFKFKEKLDLLYFIPCKFKAICSISKFGYIQFIIIQLGKPIN